MSERSGRRFVMSGSKEIAKGFSVAKLVSRPGGVVE
jgi:hypothetical protein